MSARARFLLPPEAYYSPRWWQAEQRDVFGHTYNLVAYESDVPQPGDSVVAQVGTESVLVVRLLDGDIEAYTGLDRRGGIHPEPDMAPAGRCAVGRWAGMVFAHVAVNPPPFEDWLGDFIGADKAGPYDWDELVEVDRVEVPLRCNWKLYIENHLDIYHLWHLHAETLGMYDHATLTWWEAGPHWGCVELIHRGQTRSRPGMLPIASVPPGERRLLRANLIFPNVPMTTMETSVATFQVIPTGPETCSLDLRIRGQRGSVVTDRNAFLRVQKDEDGTACEAVQAAIRSPAYSVGPLAADHELPIQHFQEHILALLERSRRASTV
jgi:Rieske 2Fe-2S family protein